MRRPPVTLQLQVYLLKDGRSRSATVDPCLTLRIEKVQIAGIEAERNAVTRFYRHCAVETDCDYAGTESHLDHGLGAERLDNVHGQSRARRIAIDLEMLRTDADRNIAA